MTDLIAAYAFVAVIAALSIGALGLVFGTTVEIRRTIKRGIGDR
jgi:hypothetical protein